MFWYSISVKPESESSNLSIFKDFIAKGDVLVERASLVLNEILVGTLMKGELEKGNRDLKGIYKLYLANLDSGDKKTGSFYKDLNPQYLEIKNCFGRGLLLLSKISDATTSFRAAHKELVTLLSTKDSKVVAKSIARFTDEASQIDDLIKQFKPTN